MLLLLVTWGCWRAVCSYLVFLSQPTLLLSVVGVSGSALVLGLGGVMWLLERLATQKQPFSIGAEGILLEKQHNGGSH